MNYDKMVLEAIRNAAISTGDSEDADTINLYATEILDAIRANMNANGVVFYQP